MTIEVAPRVSAVICAFTEERWGDLQAAVASVRSQSRAPDEVIVVVDHNVELLGRASRGLDGVRVVANEHPRGLSGARNSGIEAAGGELIAFLDDDALAEPDWLSLLLEPYADRRVLGVGGAVAARWDEGRPPGFPEEFDWVVGCSYRGLPERRSPVRNVIGANMSFRRDVLETVGGFRDGIGRVGRRPVGCEETELCLRAHAMFPDGVILYEPRARVLHRVPATRASWRYFGARCYSEGISKALVARHAGARRGLSSERAYALRTLPRGAKRDLRAAVRAQDLAGLARAAALVGGLMLTTAGFAAGTTRHLVGGRRRARTAARDRWLHLDVHGRVGICIEADAPGARQLCDMFAPFQSERIDCCDLVVHGRLEDLGGLVAGEGPQRYGIDALELPGRLQVVRDGASLSLNGEGELLAPVLALLDALLVSRAAAMVHVAAVERDGRGVCLGAAGGAGKSSGTIGLVRERGFAFMGDDWSFLSSDGRILGFAKPLFVRPHHRALFPELFAQKRKPLVPPHLTAPLGRLATAAHPAISRHPRLARRARALWPEHLIVRPEAALPGVRIAREAELAAMVFVERAAQAGPTLQERDASWMASRLVGDFFAELPRPARDLQTALASGGLLALDRMLADKATVVRGALAKASCQLLRLPQSMGAAEAARTIAATVDCLLAESGDRR